MPSTNFFQDPDFQNHLVALLCRDPGTLKQCSHLVTAQDFRPQSGQGSKSGYARWLISDLALTHFRKYREPIGALLRSQILGYARKNNLNAGQLDGLLELSTQIRKLKLTGVTATVDQVLDYKRDRMKTEAVEELIALQGQGKLSDEKWLEISHRAIDIVSGTALQCTDYLEHLEDRIERRRQTQHQRHNPFLLIDPFDVMVKSIGRGHLGLALAPYKRGKSMFLIHISRAYVLQHLNVLFITLEDPLSDVEDRFDAAVTALPVHQLTELPKRLRRRFSRFQKTLRARLDIYDGTEGGVSVDYIDHLMEERRDRGFPVDACIVDYDDEIETQHKKERRFEFADIYRGLRRVGAKHSAIMWTAAQTQRFTEDLKVISGDRLAEDISKIRKATMAVSLGKGEWGDESYYLWVAAHKFDTQHQGCNIMGNKKRMLFYDRDATRERMDAEELSAEEEVE